MYKLSKICAVVVIGLALGLSSIVPTATAANNLGDKLSGRILLQVEENGEAWYVNPLDEKRYYMGRPADAFELMRHFGLGITYTELNTYLHQDRFPSRLSGRILLSVEKNGEAYYIYPENLKGYYLGRPADAFSIMRSLGLGITNADLETISIGEGSLVPTKIPNETAPISVTPPVDDNQGEVIQSIVDMSLVDDVYTYPITIEGSVYTAYQLPNRSFRILCPLNCLENYAVTDVQLRNKVVVLDHAFAELTVVSGITFNPEMTLVDVHYFSDGICGDFADFSAGTGQFRYTADGRGSLCLFSAEKSNLFVPFTEDNSTVYAATTLALHEAVHGLFNGTQVTYWTQEYFAKMLSRHISGTYRTGPSNDDSSFDRHVGPGGNGMIDLAPLPYYLYQYYGLDVDDYPQIFQTMQNRANAGENIGTNDFKEIIDSVVGTDTIQAYIDAGITISN